MSIESQNELSKSSWASNISSSQDYESKILESLILEEKEEYKKDFSKSKYIIYKEHPIIPTIS